MNDVENAGFSKELNAFIKEWKEKPGSLIMILHKVQEEQGYISQEAARAISIKTGTHLAKIYGVMSFYHFFKTKKPGTFKISVCMGTACYLKGGQALLEETKKLLNLSDQEDTSSDGLFSVEAVRCIGCCGLAPLLTVNGDVYGKLSTKQIPDVLDIYKNAKIKE